MELLKVFYPQLFILVVIYILVLMVIFLDLWAGIRKARRRGEYRSSYGFRKTVDKVSRYFNMLFVITAIDVVQMLAISQLNNQTDYSLPILPFFTFLGAIFVGFIELKSIYEKSEQKDKAKINEAAKILAQLMQRGDDQEAIANIFNYIKTAKKGEEANGTS